MVENDPSAFKADNARPSEDRPQRLVADGVGAAPLDVGEELFGDEAGREEREEGHPPCEDSGGLTRSGVGGGEELVGMLLHVVGEVEEAADRPHKGEAAQLAQKGGLEVADHLNRPVEDGQAALRSNRLQEAQKFVVCLPRSYLAGDRREQAPRRCSHSRE